MKRMNGCAVAVAAAMMLWSGVAAAEDGPKFVSHVEFGFLDVLSHTVQFGKDGTDFDYVKDGGQDTLFTFARLAGTFSFNPRHHIKLLYQPITIDSRVRLENELNVNDVTFNANEAVNLLYGFPFYRLSYLYSVVDTPALNVSLGGSLQIRNATINFQSESGEKLVSQRDVGPVPLLKVQARYNFDNGYWLGTEIDGIYAPISYLNGSENEVVGALLDASVRAGYTFQGGLETFLNLRYIGGGAEGQSDETGPRNDGYTKNWIHLASVSLGVNFDWTYGFRGKP